MTNIINSLINILVHGLWQLPWWGYLAFVLIVTQITIFSVTIYLHRHSAHRALELHPVVKHFFRFWLWLTTGQSTKAWTAIHRKHHARVETDEDPHSPQTRGLRKVLLEGAELYRAEAKDKETLERFGEGTPNDWLELRLYGPHSTAGVIAMLVIDIALFGFLGMTIWAIQMAWIPFWAAGVVNGVGHYWGYRNFESEDASRNLVPWGLFIGGEELHNNHHTYATSAKFSVKPWEVDIGWGMIRLLQLFGLATPKRVVPKPKLVPNKNLIDVDTLKGLVSNRFQVMSRYAKEVILPVLREEKKRADKAGQNLLRRARTLLVREKSLLKSPHWMTLNKMLDTSQMLRTVYDFRLQLQAIWSRNTASTAELVEALQEWCRQAEATRIEVLSRFSKHLRMYAV